MLLIHYNSRDMLISCILVETTKITPSFLKLLPFESRSLPVILYLFQGWWVWPLTLVSPVLWCLRPIKSAVRNNKKKKKDEPLN